MGIFDFMRTASSRDYDALQSRYPGVKVNYDRNGRGMFVDSSGMWQPMPGDEYSYSNDQRPKEQKDADMAQYKAQQAGLAAPSAPANGLQSTSAQPKYTVDETAANIPGYADWQKALASGAAAVGNRTGPQDEWRQQQSSLAQALMASANGTGPSVAQAQLNQASDRNLANAMAMAHSQRGMGAAGNMRALANQRAAIGQQQASDSGMLRLQEQQGAQQSLGSLLSGSRGQDIAQQGQNDAATQYYLSQGMSLASAQQQANADMQKLKSNNALGFGTLSNQQTQTALQAKAEQDQSNAQTAQAVGAQTATYMKAISDKNLKTDITPAAEDLSAFLDAVGAHKYRYKDEKHGKGEFVSPMAQELLKTALGRTMVEQGDDGLQVDYGRGFGTMLASQSELHRRLKRLEGDE